MSIHAIGWVFRQDIRPSADKFVLVAMADYTGESGLAYPSMAALSKKTCQDRKTVIAALDRLEKKGLIADTGKRTGKTRQVKVYRMCWADETDPNAELLKAPVFPVKGSQKRDTEPSGNPQLVEKIGWDRSKSWSGVTECLKAELAAAYPACDVGHQFLVMEQWLKANPERAHKSNWRKFINNWFAKAQDRGGDIKNNGATQSNYTRGNRTAGTANERRASQYAGIGRMGADPRHSV